MGDNWVIIVGLLGLVLFFLMPSLIGRITGRRVQVRTRTGSFFVEPFKTRKERQEDDERDAIIKELNDFCDSVYYARILSKNSNNKYDRWNSDYEFKILDSNLRPMLTESAALIVNSGNVENALIGYKSLEEKLASKIIPYREYCNEILQLYDKCT